MHKLIEKRHIRYLTLRYRVLDLEKKYQQQRFPQIVLPYVYNLITLFVLEVIIFILYILNSDAGSGLWICGSIFAVIVPFIAYMLIYHQKHFLYYHIFWNFLCYLQSSAINYLYFYTFKQNSALDSSSPSSAASSKSITFGNLDEVDLLLFLFTHEAITLSQAFFIDSCNFTIDASLIILNRIINGIIFGTLIKSNVFLNIFFYLVPIFLIFNRYVRELIERARFLENNNNSEWVNIIDNMYNTSLIVSRWDNRHQTIELIRVSANAETKYRIFNSESMKNFYSRIQLDMKNCDIQISNNITEDGKKLTLKDYLLWRCVHQEEQKQKKQNPKKKAQKLNHQLSYNLKQQDSLKQEFQSAKRQRCKSQHQRNLVESETLIGYYYRQAEDQNYSRIFRIKVSNFQMNDIALVTSIEDITYQDDIKYFQNSKIQSDKLLLQTLNDFRIKLVPIITGVVEFEKANLEEQYDNVVETIKYNTYLIMNHIYVLFDYFAINEKRGVTIKMAQFSFKQMIWDIVGMFQAQAKINSIKFVHKNNVRRMDKTFSDERRIKQVLITVLSNALNMVSQGQVSFKVGLDRNEQNLSQSFTDSPTSRSHPSLKFEIDIEIGEKKKRREDVSEDFEQLFKKIENQVIDELVKTLGPYQIKMEEVQENNTIKISFAIYADFVNLRKEERLHSLIRPEISINYSQQNQRQRATTKSNALTQVRQAKKSTESAPPGPGSSHLIQVGSYGTTQITNNEKSPILKELSIINKNLQHNLQEENTKEQPLFDQKQLIDFQMREFEEHKIRVQQERGKNLTLTPAYGGRANNKGQKRSTTIRHGSNILNSIQHQSFLSNLSAGGDTIILHTVTNGSQNISANENDLSNNNSNRRLSNQDNNSRLSNKHSILDNLTPQRLSNQDGSNNSFDKLSQINKLQHQSDLQIPSNSLIDEENLRPSEAVLDKDNNIKQLVESQNVVESVYLGNKFSSYFSKAGMSDNLLFDGDKSVGKSPSIFQSQDKFIFNISQYDDESNNYFLHDNKDSINEQNVSQISDNTNLDFRVKKVSIFSPSR